MFRFTSNMMGVLFVLTSFAPAAAQTSLPTIAPEITYERDDSALMTAPETVPEASDAPSAPSQPKGAVSTSLYEQQSEGQALSLSGAAFSTERARQAKGYTPFQSDDQNRLMGSTVNGGHYGVMLDSKYALTPSGSLLTPYLSSGLGVASGTPAAAGGALMRFGAGSNIQTGENWNLSVDYQNGFGAGAQNEGPTSTTAKGNQSINMGLKYKF